MENLLLTSTILLLIAILVVLVIRTKTDNKPTDQISTLLNQLGQQQGQQLQSTVNLLLQQLNKQQEAQDRSSHLIHTRIDHTAKIVGDFQGKLMQLEEANKHILELGKDISSLQRILQAPKLRGTMGEIWLAEIIAQIIPPDRYKMQYTFKSGETCDAAIFLRDGTILPIDSKFSLENFTKMMDAEDGEKASYKKLFISDVKKRIDEIAKKYILPSEGTLECAFMYVPAENVYYQSFIQDEDTQLLNYAFSKHIIPVSPSSFYAYLQVILFGLRGMEIEKSAKDIQKNLSGLQNDFVRFQDIYEKVGSHLRHAQQSYEQSDKRLGGIQNKFVQITQKEQTLIEIDESITTLPDES